MPTSVEVGHRGNVPVFQLTSRLSEDDIRKAFPPNSFNDAIGNYLEYGMGCIGAEITWEINRDRFQTISIDPAMDQSVQAEQQLLASVKGNPFRSYSFKRLLSERDIRPEIESGVLKIEANGEGATNTLQRFINERAFPSELIERDVLRELNRIMEPDARFTRIVVQKTGPYWELFLEEEEKGRISLTHTGSGVKTVLLVLLYVYLFPFVENKQLSEYIFTFEELENNLHPALQRRLLLYLRELAIEYKCRFFLTTHSSVAIDLFAKDQHAQILHVTHNGRNASVKTVRTYVENCGILDDLDVRASDLLQANGIVWVEGPSDRLYFNRWIDLWSNGTLREGTHYQCVFYGGRLLARLSADINNIDVEDAVIILRVNRNAILLIDSDKRAKANKINETKKRMIAEVTQVGGLGWLTAGKEIENYIPCEVINLIAPGAAMNLGQYEDVFEYLERVRAGTGKHFARNKVLFAERVNPLLTREHLQSTLDLQHRLTQSVNLIRRWNSIHYE